MEELLAEPMPVVVIAMLLDSLVMLDMALDEDEAMVVVAMVVVGIVSVEVIEVIEGVNVMVLVIEDISEVMGMVVLEGSEVPVPVTPLIEKDGK